jgi:hypothetical protein
MSFLNLFGSESKTDQTAYNQQAGASQGSVAVGANASGNRITISTADPNVAEAAIQGNALVANNAELATVALAGKALDTNALVNVASLEANANVAGQAITAVRDVSGYAMATVSSSSQQLVKTAASLANEFMGKLNENYQNSLTFASASLTTATQAEQAALAQTNNLVSGIVSQYSDVLKSQTPGGAALAVETTASKTQFNTVLVVGAALVLLYLISQK